ncbi:hypothetical protein BJX70DRAFT_371716 [Aspergillus crustosus]
MSLNPIVKDICEKGRFELSNTTNRALPLWQGFTDTRESQAILDAVGGRPTFQQYLASEDPSI